MGNICSKEGPNISMSASMSSPIMRGSFKISIDKQKNKVHLIHGRKKKSLDFKKLEHCSTLDIEHYKFDI